VVTNIEVHIRSTSSASLNSSVNDSNKIARRKNMIVTRYRGSVSNYFLDQGCINN